MSLTAMTADKLGREYMMLKKERQAALNKQVTAVVSDIFSLARKKGVKKGKRCVVEGDNFVVGFIEPEPSMEIDPVKFMRVISKEQYMRLTKRVIDLDLVEQAVADGTISRKVLSKCLVQSKRKFEPRVYVGKVGQDAQDDF